MADTISEHFFRFAHRRMPDKQVADYIAYTQDEFYFQLALHKKNRIDLLREHFSHTKVRKIIISGNLRSIGFKLEGYDIVYLEHFFFSTSDGQTLDQKIALLEDSIVLVNNNDIAREGGMSTYAEIYSRCNTTIFAGWDWDNHHWMELSTFLAAHSDMYIPAHNENLYLLTRFNWLTAGPVHIGTVQWSKKYLSDHLPDMLSIERSDSPLGKHNPYDAFRFRMQAIITLNQHYQTIGFNDGSFHSRTDNERLREWASHKSHWVVPVLNDVPIRIFDALITGGIPIVPESLRYLPPVCNIKREYILFYSALDILMPEKIVAAANELFDNGGLEKMVERHVYALKRHHGTHAIRTIFDYIYEHFSIKLVSDIEYN